MYHLSQEMLATKHKTHHYNKVVSIEELRNCNRFVTFKSSLSMSTMPISKRKLSINEKSKKEIDKLTHLEYNKEEISATVVSFLLVLSTFA